MVGLLAGRFALVTGGGSGIGRAVCQTFAKEGAAVAAVDINRNSVNETLSLLEHHGVLSKAYTLDVSSSSSVAGLLSNIKRDFSRPPCIAVNAAGISRAATFLKMDEKVFEEVVKVNLKGTFLVSQAVARAVAEAKLERASIINISSIFGKKADKGPVNETASKAGVVALTKSAAAELAKYNIRVNCILPGLIDTPMTDSLPEKVRELCISDTLLQRIGRPEEVADACVFLATEKSSFVTGVALEVTGGLFV